MEIEEIRNLRKSGKKLSEIATLFGVSRQRIHQMIGNTGIFYKYPKGMLGCFDCKKVLFLNQFYGSSKRCIPCTKAFQKKYITKYRKEYLKGGKYHSRALARAAVMGALKSGRITKGDCILQSDNCSGRLEAHHPNGYEKEQYLDIQWLCRKHHQETDGNWR